MGAGGAVRVKDALSVLYQNSGHRYQVV